MRHKGKTNLNRCFILKEQIKEEGDIVKVIALLKHPRGGAGAGKSGLAGSAGTPRGGARLGWAVKENLIVCRKTPSKKNYTQPSAGEAGPHSGTGGGRLGWKSWLAGSLPPPGWGGVPAAKLSSVGVKAKIFSKGKMQTLPLSVPFRIYKKTLYFQTPATLKMQNLLLPKTDG
jgi:hypothetical protein